jgi:hypothetical protein
MYDLLLKSKFVNFNVQSLLLHWNSKIFSDFIINSHVYRLPITVTAPNVEQLLGVQK